MGNDDKLMIPTGDRDSFILCRNSQGMEVRATLLRLTRYLAVFEVYNPYSILQLSEVLSEFRIVMNERLVYSGRAVVSSIVNTGIVLVCEATLDESWLDVDVFTPINQPERLRSEFQLFIQEYEKTRRVSAEFKIMIADLQTLLMDLRRWLEQIELAIRSEPGGNRTKMERDVIHQIQEPMVPMVMSWFNTFDEVADRVDEELAPTHRSYARRQLHPLVLCSPFVYRTFRKPLGYAGDYEMVNMILRDPLEGSSLFAKIVNVCFLMNPPAEAHRNRIQYLVRLLSDETRRVARAGKRTSVLNLGCGPAKEIQDFLVHDEMCDRVDFTLLDFNDETLTHTTKLLGDLKMQHRRRTGLNMCIKSVHQVLKEAGRNSRELQRGGYDVVYCAGLFDYMSDRICKRLMNIFYDLLAPGGMLVATNVDASKPFRHSMEYLLEWHLICRDQPQLLNLVPELAPPGTFKVRADETGVNVFIEVRKPEDAR